METRSDKLMAKRFPLESRKYDSGAKLLFLKELANDPNLRWVKAARRDKMRARFDKMKLSREYTRCWVCLRTAQCFHHMTPISRNGSYHWQNVVELCHWCHAEIHPWLRKKGD